MNKTAIEILDRIKRQQANSEKDSLDAAVRYAEKSELKDQIEFNMHRSFATKIGWLVNDMQRLLLQLEKEVSDATTKGESK